jgi:hypothetical protein
VAVAVPGDRRCTLTSCARSSIYTGLLTPDAGAREESDLESRLIARLRSPEGVYHAVGETVVEAYTYECCGGPLDGDRLADYGESFRSELPCLVKSKMARIRFASLRPKCVVDTAARARATSGNPTDRRRSASVTQ